MTKNPQVSIQKVIGLVKRSGTPYVEAYSYSQGAHARMDYAGEIVVTCETGSIYAREGQHDVERARRRRNLLASLRPAFERQTEFEYRLRHGQQGVAIVIPPKGQPTPPTPEWNAALAHMEAVLEAAKSEARQEARGKIVARLETARAVVSALEGELSRFDAGPSQTPESES